MNIRKRAGGVVGIVAMASIVTLAVSGCTRGGGGGEAGDGAAEASPGITDTTITLGVTTPLSGPTAGPGTCTVAGLEAYMGAANAAGGSEFGDGKTRTVEIKTYDDQYDPQKSLANFQQMVSDGVFASTSGLGTPTNRAYREAAIDEEFPQVLVMTGDPLFGNQEESPWQLGFVPIDQNEGAAFGDLLAASRSSATAPTCPPSRTACGATWHLRLPGTADARGHLGEHHGRRTAGRLDGDRAEVQRQGLRSGRVLGLIDRLRPPHRTPTRLSDATSPAPHRATGIVEPDRSRLPQGCPGLQCEHE